jgi:hypothetical protein
MKLNQNATNTKDLEHKVSTHGGRKQKPPGGPSNGESVDEYKQRLFNWLVKNAPALHDWCVSKSIHSAVPTVTVSRQDLKLKF